MSFLITTRSSPRPLRLALSSVALTRARSSFRAGLAPSWSRFALLRPGSGEAFAQCRGPRSSNSSPLQNSHHECRSRPLYAFMRPSLIGVNHLVVVPSSLRSNDFAVTVVTKMPVRTRVPGKNWFFVMAITARSRLPASRAALATERISRFRGGMIGGATKTANL